MHVHQEAKVDTQELRNKWISELDSIFDVAASIAKGKVNQQQVGDKLQSITPKERQMWAQVAASIGQVMGNLAKGYDVTKFDEDLDHLEELLKDLEKPREEDAKGEVQPGTTKL